MIGQSPILGTVIIILGFIAMFIALAPILVNILFFLLALYLINYGLRLRGMPPATTYARTIWFSFRRPR